jgi:TRAP-type C4-dicarboxylate transport system permease small subunit
MVDTFERILDRHLGKIVDALAIIILVFLVTMIFASVLSRYVLNFSLAWAEELAGLSFVWLTMLGSITAMRKRSHMAINFLLDRLPPAKQRWMLLYVHAAIVFFLAVIVWQGATIFRETLSDYSAVLRLRIGWYYLSLPVCGFLMILYSARDIARLLRGDSLGEAEAVEEG